MLARQITLEKYLNPAMNPLLLDLFQREVNRQCKFALTAVEDMESALGTDALNLDRFWYSVQALLVAVGNISKLLWPSNPHIPERGRELRSFLLVDDESVLTPRRFRNHFEHFDERLEDWATSSHRHNIADSNIGPPNMIVGLDPSDFLRNFDTSRFAITFRGDVYEVRPIIEAIRPLLVRTSENLGD
jgi:hypothetical protein